MLAAGVGYYLYARTPAQARTDLLYHTVRKEPMQLTVVERGTLESARQSRRHLPGQGRQQSQQPDHQMGHRRRHARQAGPATRRDRRHGIAGPTQDANDRFGHGPRKHDSGGGRLQDCRQPGHQRVGHQRSESQAHGNRPREIPQGRLSAKQEGHREPHQARRLRRRATERSRGLFRAHGADEVSQPGTAPGRAVEAGRVQSESVQGGRRAASAGQLHQVAVGDGFSEQGG